MLKSDKFEGTEDIIAAFEKSKIVISSVQAITMPNFISLTAWKLMLLKWESGQSYVSSTIPLFSLVRS